MKGEIAAARLAVKECLADLGIYPDRREGQTFLTDTAVAEREAAALPLDGGETVLEIGPGLGILTEALSRRCARVIAVEKDRRLVRYLKGKILHDNVEVIEGDAMVMDLPSFDIATGNLPYSVASQLLFRLSNLNMERGLFMLQEEVVNRITAVPGTAEYSRISVSMQRLYSVRRLFSVSHAHFYPQPDVDSAVIALNRLPDASASADFDSVVRLLFTQRRKKIRASVRHFYPALEGDVPHSERRIEELSLSEIEELVASIIKGKGADGR